MVPKFRLGSTFTVLAFVKMVALTFSQEVTVKPPINFQENYIPVGMCIPKGDPSGISDGYCKCEKNVVSCDFSTFKSTNWSTAELRAFWKEDTINRICICNAPKNLQVVLSEYFISGSWNVSRVDIFNMEGPVIIDNAFGVYFSGDMYISKVSRLRTMFAWEYGRGRDSERTNHPNKRDPTVLKCCSEIKTPKFASPTFYMEESTVNAVHTNALNSEHLWKNIIFNSVTFRSMGSYGIVLNGQEENASFTNCHFHRMNRTAIAVNDVANFLLAHNTFHPTCDKTPIGARSYGSSSVIAFIQNRFENQTTMEIDAKEISIWFNSFNIWNAETFLHLNYTVHGDRVASIEFNTVDHYELKGNDILPMKSFDKIIFNENLILPCNCDVIANLALPKLFQNYTQRCYSESGERKEPCHLKMKEVEAECKQNGKPDYAKLCGKSENNFKSFAYSKTFQEVEPFLTKVSFQIKSPFINDMLRHVKSPFQLSAKKLTKSSTAVDCGGTKLYILWIFAFALLVLK